MNSAKIGARANIKSVVILVQKNDENMGDVKKAYSDVLLPEVKNQQVRNG